MVARFKCMTFPLVLTQSTSLAGILQVVLPVQGIKQFTVLLLLVITSTLENLITAPPAPKQPAQPAAVRLWSLISLRVPIRCMWLDVMLLGMRMEQGLWQ